MWGEVRIKRKGEGRDECRMRKVSGEGKGVKRGIRGRVWGEGERSGVRGTIGGSFHHFIYQPICYGAAKTLLTLHKLERPELYKYRRAGGKLQRWAQGPRCSVHRHKHIRGWFSTHIYEQ